MTTYLEQQLLTDNPAQSSTERTIPTLSPQVAAAPSLTPTILDPTAPNPQLCPGYKASALKNTSSGFTATLTLAGPACQAYGNDIESLTLEVQYQASSRLNVKIYPAYLAPQNQTRYVLSPELVLAPSWDGNTTAKSSDLVLTWTNEPTFQFKVTRSSTGEELFSTYGSVIVYEDQFLEIRTNMVEVSRDILFPLRALSVVADRSSRTIPSMDSQKTFTTFSWGTTSPRLSTPWTPATRLTGTSMALIPGIKKPVTITALLGATPLHMVCTLATLMAKSGCLETRV